MAQGIARLWGELVSLAWRTAFAGYIVSLVECAARSSGSEQPEHFCASPMIYEECLGHLENAEVCGELSHSEISCDILVVGLKDTQHSF